MALAMCHVLGVMLDMPSACPARAAEPWQMQPESLHPLPEAVFGSGPRSSPLCHTACQHVARHLGCELGRQAQDRPASAGDKPIHKSVPCSQWQTQVSKQGITLPTESTFPALPVGDQGDHACLSSMPLHAQPAFPEMAQPYRASEPHSSASHSLNRSNTSGFPYNATACEP